MPVGKSKKELRTLDAMERLDQQHQTHCTVTTKIKDEFVKRSLETPHLKFAGKVALTTGGTRGIGAVTTRRVAELGADVVITGRRGREGRRLVDEINRNGGSADFIQSDLTQPDQVGLVVPFTLKAFGRLDYAFNNAGDTRQQPSARGSDGGKLRPCLRGKREGAVPAAST
jgi:short chain dehydrogenase